MTAIVGIRADLLETLLRVGEAQHPDEFLALLRAEKGIIEEFEFVPGTIAGETSAAFSPEMRPLGIQTAGSAHSHPNGVLLPSQADIRFFSSMGSVHLILGPPYAGDSWRAFTWDGKPRDLEVVE